MTIPESTEPPPTPAASARPKLLTDFPSLPEAPRVSLGTPTSDEDLWQVFGRVAPWASKNPERPADIRSFLHALMRYAGGQAAGDPEVSRAEAVELLPAVVGIANDLTLPMPASEVDWPRAARAMRGVLNRRALAASEPQQQPVPTPVGEERSESTPVAEDARPALISPILVVEGSSESTPTFRGLCALVRSRIESLEDHVVMSWLSIADLLADAKAAYERETGTGMGKRNPKKIPSFVMAVAAEIERTPSTVQNYVKLAELDPAIRSEIAKRPAVARDLSMLLSLARATDATARERALKAFDEGGKKAAREALAGSPLFEAAEADPKLAAVLKDVRDPTALLGGLDNSYATPNELKAAHPVLGEFATIGDIRKALTDGSTPKRPREVASFRQENALGVHCVEVGVQANGEAESVDMGCGVSHDIRFISVVVPWTHIEQLVEDRRKAEEEAAEVADELGHVALPSSVTITEGFATLVILDRGRKVRGPKR